MHTCPSGMLVFAEETEICTRNRDCVQRGRSHADVLCACQAALCDRPEPHQGAAYPHPACVMRLSAVMSGVTLSQSSAGAEFTQSTFIILPLHIVGWDGAEAKAKPSAFCRLPLGRVRRPPWEAIAPGLAHLCFWWLGPKQAHMGRRACCKGAAVYARTTSSANADSVAPLSCTKHVFTVCPLSCGLSLCIQSLQGQPSAAMRCGRSTCASQRGQGGRTDCGGGQRTPASRATSKTIGNHYQQEVRQNIRQKFTSYCTHISCNRTEQA